MVADRVFHRWRNCLLAAIVLALAAAPWPAGAGGPVTTYQGPEAEVLIKACWDKTLEERSIGSTARTRAGILKTVLCLEEVILDQFEVLFPGGVVLTREQAAEKLKALRFAAGGLYWDIYNNNGGCAPGCGTMYHTFHLSENAIILEDMIRKIIRTRKEYGF
ncbi:MAG: hypothetical protein QF654_03760 [Alphaproteobacteria bacterium]|jgi:hypothetical protein|nr:hypothetical protein [Alphaproteobacteria bacterium]